MCSKADPPLFAEGQIDAEYGGYFKDKPDGKLHFLTTDGKLLKLPRWELTFEQGKLVLEQAGGRPRIERKLAREDLAARAACSLPDRTFLDAAYVDPERGVALLRLATCGEESCPNPDSWYEPLSLR